MKHRLIVRASFAAFIVATILIGALSSRVSVSLAILLVIVIPAAVMWVGHNFNPLTAPLRKRDDQFIFRMCQAGGVGPFRRVYRRLPSDPRCRVCLVPFGGVGRILRIHPSRKNPNFCTDCLESAPLGVHEMEVGILFADLRGFTAWAEKHSPDAVAAGLTQFYALASRVLTRDDALLEFIGDQVMALYLPDFPSLRQRTSEVMISAAERLLREIDRQQAEDVLPVGVGIHIGVASVGNVGKGETKDFTAVGDVVNTTARLQSCALGGQIILSEEVYRRAAGSCPRAEPTSLSVKGKSEPLQAYVIHAHRGGA